MRGAERIEGFAQAMLARSPGTQEKAWAALAGVLTESEIKGLKEYVGLYHMLTDSRLYKAVMEAVGNQIYSEMKGGQNERDSDQGRA